MPAQRKGQSVVKIWVEKKWYEIKCDKPKIERKQDMNLRTACNELTPYEVNPGGVEYTVELPSVSHGASSLFKRIMKRQETGKRKSSVSLAVFSYDTKGKLVRDWYLGLVYFESMSQEGNEPFDVKGGALVNYDN